MATKHVTHLIDDLDGSVLEDGAGKTVSFSLDGRAYEIDLSTDNASELQDVFAPYVNAARTTKSESSGRGGRTSGPRRDVDLNAVREWARANGYTVSDRGRVAATIVEAYQAAVS